MAGASKARSPARSTISLRTLVGTIVRLLSVVTGALSLALLIHHGFDYQFVAIVQGLLDLYEQGMATLLSGVQLWVLGWLRTLGALLGLDLHLYPHWKHVLVLLWLYFGAMARAVWSAHHYGYAAFVAGLGIAIGLLTSITLGTVPISAGVEFQALFTMLPVAAYVAYEGVSLFIGAALFRLPWPFDSYRDSLFRFARYPVHRAAVGLLAMIVATQVDQIPGLRDLQNPGLALLILLMAALGFYWVWSGKQGSQDEADLDFDQRDAEQIRLHRPHLSREQRVIVTWHDAFRYSAGTRLGIAMLEAIGGAVLIVGIDYVLRIAGF